MIEGEGLIAYQYQIDSKIKLSVSSVNCSSGTIMFQYFFMSSVIYSFCSANANGGGKDQEPTLSCEADWSQVGTDCLLFHEDKLTHSSAKAFCKEKDSQLIEFETSEHLDQFSEWLKKF